MSKLDEIRERIPLYLNQKLSEEEKREFENTLNQFPELKLELKEFSEIKGIYQEIERDISLPSETLYQRVLDNLEPQEKLSWASPEKDYWKQIQWFFKSIFSSPRLSWGIAAVQFAIILVLLVTLPKGDGFKTLTSKQTLQGEGVRIHIIFEMESKEKEMREVLNRVGATIVKGPSPEGLYTIQIKEGRDMNQVLKNLKQTKIVRFAEKSYE